MSTEIEKILKEKNDLQCQKDKELVELEKKWSQEYNKIKNEKDELFMSEFFCYRKIRKKTLKPTKATHKNL